MKVYNFSEEESQDGNDQICLFFGGTIEPCFGGGEQYRFDKPGTDPIFMKCPPFGVLPRSTDYGIRIMRFHEDYNHLMPIIKYCYSKTQNNRELQSAFYNIKDSLCMFDYVTGSCVQAHRAVLEFIDLYNKLENNYK